MFKLYNGAPNRALQEHWDELARQKAEVDELARQLGEEGASITWFPYGEFYCGFIKYELVTDDCKSHYECYVELKKVLEERRLHECSTFT